MSSSFLRCLEMLGDVLLVKARGKSPLASPRPGRGSSAVGSQESDQAGLVLKVLGVLTFWGFLLGWARVPGEDSSVSLLKSVGLTKRG